MLAVRGTPTDVPRTLPGIPASVDDEPESKSLTVPLLSAESEVAMQRWPPLEPQSSEERVLLAHQQYLGGARAAYSDSPGLTVISGAVTVICSDGRCVFLRDR